MKYGRKFNHTYDLREILQFYVRVVDGVGGGTPLPALLTFLGAEVTLAGVVRGVDMVAAAKAHDLLPGALGCRLHMPAGLMGADEVALALCADPLASDGAVLDAVEASLDGLDVVSVNQGGENGERRREARAIWRGYVDDARIGHVVREAVLSISGKNRSLR